MSAEKWGSTEWNENHFPVEQLDTEGDTWGIRWRGMEKMRHQSYLNIVSGQLKNRDSINILDIGCALCDFTGKVWNLNKSNNIWAMDISETAIAWDTKNFPEFEFQVGASPEIPFDIDFDLIFFLEIMCYLNSDERIQAIRNIRSKLKPGGKILFSGVLDGGVQHHTTEEVLQLIGSEFTIEKVHFNHWALHRMIIDNPLSKIDARALRFVEDLTMTADEYSEAKRRSISDWKAKFLYILRALNPVSTWLFKSVSWGAKRVIGWKLLATTLHILSKYIRGPNQANEIVVLGIRTEDQ